MSAEELLIETHGDTMGSLQILAALPPDTVHKLLQVLVDRDLLQAILLLEARTIGMAELKVLAGQNLCGRTSRPYSVEVIEKVVDDLRQWSRRESLSTQWPSDNNSLTTSTRNSIGSNYPPSSLTSPRGSVISAAGTNLETDCDICGRQSRAAKESDGSKASAARQNRAHKSLWCSTDWNTPAKLREVIEKSGISSYKRLVLPKDLLSALMDAIKTSWNDVPLYLRLEVIELYNSHARLRQVFQDSGITSDHLGVFLPEIANKLRTIKAQNDRALDWRYAVLHSLDHYLNEYELSLPEPPKSNPPKSKRPRDSRLVTLERRQRLENSHSLEASFQGDISSYSPSPSATSMLEPDAIDNVPEPVSRWLNEEMDDVQMS